MKQRRELVIKILVWALRVLCGGLFIFSGFVKAIDPWGTLFKINEYLGAFGVGMPFALVRLVVFGLCAIEFIVGSFLLLGCFRKSCPVFGCLIMAFMLPLSLWIAIENPVADCGCFGDAWHVSNWFTFWKNVVISGGLLYLLRYNLVGICLVSPYFQWLAILASGIFILVIEMFGFFYQPLLDFRRFPVGSELFSDEETGYYDGLDVFDINTGDDKNQEASDLGGRELVVMMPKVSMVSPATTWKLNSLYEWSQEQGVKMIGIVSGSTEEIEEWQDLSMAAYPLYLADDTAIEEVVRGNPGIVYLDKGRIVWKATLASINVDDFLSPEVSQDASAFSTDTARLLRNISFIYLIFMTFLIFISFTPRLAQLLIRGGLNAKRGVRHH